MRNVLGFVTALAFALLVGGLIRASAASRDGGEPQTVQEDHSKHGEEKKEPKKEEPAKDEDTTSKDKKTEKDKAEPKPEPAVELENSTDPVSGKEVGESETVLEHKAWKIRFESEANRDKFLKKPIRYYAKLSLEPTTEGKLLKVDASKYEKAAPATCGVMGGDIDADGDVYVLHRGFKVFFCCWSGCGDEFVADPAKFYEHYGLVEKDGKLVKK